ncbi:cuticle protein 76 [Drosophila serrata]|uniref:cuticle protein 76 n=1 Tax=Drosophila serrata TaxID=7274 RepID=UPI000A1D0A84|nr:cuticle protein 76 [Drosophila serrata]
MAHFQILGVASTLLLLLAPTWAGIIAPAGLSYGYTGDEHAVAHTQANVVRSFDGTVSHYAKSVATPFSQVHKQDTRISNNVYQPAVAKAISYAPAPVPVSIGAPAHVYTQQAQPEPAHLFTQATSAYHHQAAPVQTPVTYHQAAPVQTYHQAAPVQTPVTYHQAAPVQTYHQAAPVQAPAVYHQTAHVESPSVYHQPAHLSHQPAVIHYSPAETVSHMSFDGFGTHYGF